MTHQEMEIRIKELEKQIKALEQEPCEDAISRQAVEKITWEEPSYSDALNVLTEVRDKVRALPPVNPQYTADEIQKMQDLEQAEIKKAYELGRAEQPKIGHWIGHREHCENLGVMPSGLGAYEWCSNCDCGIDVREWHRNNYNYCPNCGAKMVEPQESEGK